MSFEQEAFVDRIYEAAAVPELWPSLLHDVGQRAGCAGGILFCNSAAQSRWTASSGLVDLFADFLRLGHMERNARPARFLAAQHAGFLADSSLFTPEEMERDPTYEWLRQVGVGLSTGTVIPVPSGDVVVFSFDRRWSDGPNTSEELAFFDRLRPHLARSALFASRLGLASARAMAQALELVGLSAAVLRRNGTLMAANPLFERLMPAVAQDRRTRLVLTDDAADTLLRDALVAVGSAAGVVRSIPLAASEERAPLIVHLVPICGAAHDVFVQASSLLVVTPVDKGAVPTAEVLQGLFDLTPAEARVARGIGEARSIDTLADALGVSRETVRTQLKAVLAKTGVGRQAELVSLLAGKAPREAER